MLWVEGAHGEGGLLLVGWVRVRVGCEMEQGLVVRGHPDHPPSHLGGTRRGS